MSDEGTADDAEIDVDEDEAAIEESSDDGARVLAPRDAAEQARRIERLKRSLLAVDTAELKRAVLALPAPSVEALAKAARVRVPVLRAGSIKSLRRVEDPVLLDLLAGLVCDECLGAIRDLLGDDADDPTPEAVTAAVDEVIDTTYPAAMVRLTLAMVAAGLAEASDTCDRLLDSDARLELSDEPVEPEVVAPVSTGLTRTTASDEKRAARRARQAAEADRRKAQQEQAALTAAERKADRKRGSQAAAEDEAAVDDDADDEVFLARLPMPVAVIDDEPAAVAAPEPPEVDPPARRRPVLTSDEVSRFNPDDLLVGSVVIAEIGFQPDDPEVGAEYVPGSKRRPCVVIGVSPTYVLVRPGYSDGGARSRDWTSVELREWRAAGLDRPSWIETEHRRVDRDLVDDPLGRLTDDDWNALW